MEAVFLALVSQSAPPAPILLSRENILATISIAAFLMSLLSWIFAWFRRRLRINLTTIAYEANEKRSPYRGSRIIYLTLENPSNTPVVIRHFFLGSKQGKVQCCLLPVRIGGKTVNENGRSSCVAEYFSASFPITLPALAADNYLLLFEDASHILATGATEANLEVVTTRGSKWKRIPLCCPSFRTLLGFPQK